MDILAVTHSVKFEVICKDSLFGETVAVCGASPALGAWDPRQSLQLTTSPDTFPKWSSDKTINIDSGTEYKFIILQHDHRIWWESRENRELPRGIPSGSCVLISADFDRAGATLETAIRRRFASSAGTSGVNTFQLCSVFDSIDTKRRGKVNRRDLIKAIKESADVAAFFGVPQSWNGDSSSREALESVFQAIDASGSREVTWQDFHTFYAGFPPFLPPNACTMLCLTDAEDAIRQPNPTPSVASLVARYNQATPRREAGGDLDNLCIRREGRKLTLPVMPRTPPPGGLGAAVRRVRARSFTHPSVGAGRTWSSVSNSTCLDKSEGSSPAYTSETLVGA